MGDGFVKVVFRDGAVNMFLQGLQCCSAGGEVSGNYVTHQLPPIEALRELMREFGKDPVYPALWLFPAYNGHTGVGELSLTYASNTSNSFNGMYPADMSMIVTADHWSIEE